MLHDLDLSVAAFLGSLLPAGTAIRFGPPDASWASAPPTVPLLSAFAYDIRREQMTSADGMLARDSSGHATGWQPPVRRYRVSYLLTAWTGAGQEPGADGNPAPFATLPSTTEPSTTEPSAPAPAAPGEHELLGLILAGCASGDAFPDEFLRGALAGTGIPVPLACASPERATDPAQLWPALGIPARTALDLMVVAPVVPPSVAVVPAPDGVEVGIGRTQPPPPPANGDQPRPRSHITER